MRGSAPASRLQGYQRELLSYTRGRGRLSLVYKGYGPCLNQEEIIAAAGYDPEQDAEHPAGSIFCAHGAGYGVDWREVPEHAHIQGTDAVLRQRESRQEETGSESERRAGSPGSGQVWGMKQQGSAFPGGTALQKEEDRTADGEDQEQHIGQAVQNDAGVYSGFLVIGDGDGIRDAVDFLCII